MEKGFMDACYSIFHVSIPCLYLVISKITYGVETYILSTFGTTAQGRAAMEISEGEVSMKRSIFFLLYSYFLSFARERAKHTEGVRRRATAVKERKGLTNRLIPHKYFMLFYDAALYKASLS